MFYFVTFKMLLFIDQSEHFQMQSKTYLKLHENVMFSSMSVNSSYALRGSQVTQSVWRPALILFYLMLLVIILPIVILSW